MPACRKAANTGHKVAKKKVDAKGPAMTHLPTVCGNAQRKNNLLKACGNILEDIDGRTCFTAPVDLAS